MLTDIRRRLDARRARHERRAVYEQLLGLEDHLLGDMGFRRDDLRARMEESAR